MLRDQLGKKLAEAADVDFDSEMPEVNALVGKPTRDRQTGRGTNTVEIARQRFRFTDHAEKTEEEWRAERPRQDRPGRFDSRKPAPRREERRDDEYQPPARQIHFDEDGRAPEEFVAKRHTKPFARRDADDQPARTYGQRPERPAKPASAGKKPFEKKPFAKKPFGDKPFGDKPRGPSREDDDRRPAGERPKRYFGDRPRGPRPEGGSRPPRDREFTGTPRGPRRGDAGAERPAFAPRTRPESERGEGAAFRGEAKRPGRNFADKPVRGPRPASAGAKPARADEGKSFGKPRTRPDGKPYAKRDGAAPQRGPKPFGRPSGGRSSGPGRPSGPRRPKA